MGYVERCLWEYRDNLTSIELMRKELAGLMSVHGQSLERHSGNGITDPVSRVCERVMTLERYIKKAEKMTVRVCQ